MAEAHEFFCRYPSVGYNSHQRGHEERNYTLNRIEITNVWPKTMAGKVSAHASEIRAPNSKLQKVGYNQAKLKCFFVVHNYMIMSWLLEFRSEMESQMLIVLLRHA